MGCRASAGGSDEGAIAVKLDGSGNAAVLATGFADGQSLFRTLKYDPAGALLWGRAFPGHPTDLAVDAAGDVVAGGLADAPTGQQFALVKYDAAGVEAWSRTYLPAGFSSLWAGSLQVAVSLDATGNVYATGRVVGTDVRAAVVKYAPDGSFLWVRIGAHPIVDSTPIGPFLALSPNGNVIVGGSAFTPPAGPSEYDVWALDPRETRSGKPSATRLTSAATWARSPSTLLAMSSLATSTGVGSKS